MTMGQPVDETKGVNGDATMSINVNGKTVATAAGAKPIELEQTPQVEMENSVPVQKEHPHNHVEPGCHPEAVYEAALAPWRESLRKFIVSRLADESEWIGDWQERIRTPQRDKYFYWSAIVGTHTFFTAFLPLLFWLGCPERGRGLFYVVGLGIYLSCVLKDIACTPRPYCPPVTRLSLSTHHREYGFPSSHSTNAISIALYVGSWLWAARSIVGWPGVAVGWTILTAYYGTVAGGRLYTGMHSKWDIYGGTILGTLCWVLWELFGPAAEAFVNTGSLLVPIIMVPLTLGLIHYHPETPEDCPCFEDAIAILSVSLGIVLGQLNSVRNPTLPGPDLWINGPIWGVVRFLFRIAQGIAFIVVWRLAAKTILLRSLPPLFRAASNITNIPLPTRGHYMAATAYDKADAPLHAVPSFGQLPVMDRDFSQATARKPSPSRLKDDEGLRMRALKSQLRTNGNPIETDGAKIDPTAGNSHRPRRRKGPQHYDVEVLTKFIVYGGIGIFATHFLPMWFPVTEAAVGLI